MKKICAVLFAFTACAASACTGFQSGKTTGSTTAPTVSIPGGQTTGSLVGSWGEPAAFSVPSPSSCSGFQWEITSQSASAVAGTIAATCDGGIGISAAASGVLQTPTTVGVSISGSATVSGAQVCNFTLNGVGTLGDNNNSLTIPYTGTTCVGPVHGTETLRRHVDAPPAPPPVPDPVPVVPAATSLDAIDMNATIMLNSPRDFASWPITTRITGVAMGPGGVSVAFDKKDGGGRWPDVVPPGWDGPLQYTLGMAENINGQWYASTVVEFWYGLDASGGRPSEFQTNWFYDAYRWAPMTYHQLTPGELIGFVVCEGDCRNNSDGSVSPLRERSNVVLVPFPPNDNGGFTPFRFHR
ncbi:MAG TPA: hypothetical protein VHZ73_07415 [Vicinamibacterales bacterium]|jgi:hypothetical protein|nr:hypothetical protein [Vicinamibacterales bacterium]